jgi:hypothetical protein
MGLRDRIKRAERAAREEMIEIVQKDGPVARFPAFDAAAAYINLMDRLGAGENAPTEHLLLVAVRNTTDPEWQKSFYYVNDPDAHTRPVPDLCE